MSKIMLPSGRIIERVIPVSGVEQIRFKGHKVIVHRVNNVLFDAIVPGYGYEAGAYDEFWKCKEGKSVKQLLRDEYSRGCDDGYDEGYEEGVNE